MAHKQERRQCRDCGKVKPLSSFRTRRKWPDGRARTLYRECRVCAAAAEDERRKARRIRENTEVWLSPEPFAEWLAFLKRRFNLDTSAAAARAGITDRMARRILSGEQDAIGLTVVDRALTKEGTSSLWELYPDYMGGGPGG